MNPPHPAQACPGYNMMNMGMLHNMINNYNSYPNDPLLHVRQTLPNVLGSELSFSSCNVPNSMYDLIPEAVETKPLTASEEMAQERKKVHRGHPVWKYFRLWRAPDTSMTKATAHCKLCRKRKIPSASTKSAMRHLKNHHAAAHAKVLEQTEGRIFYRHGDRPRETTSCEIVTLAPVVTENNTMLKFVNFTPPSNGTKPPPSVLRSALELALTLPTSSEDKPYSSVQLSPISMESPQSPPFFNFEPKVENEDIAEKQRLEYQETTSLLKMFTGRQDGLYECNSCTFCSSYDINVFRAHQGSTHRVQKFQPKPQPPTESFQPSPASSSGIYDPRAVPSFTNEPSHFPCPYQNLNNDASLSI
ncbi:unnamed protein product, partial [Mesorhabditis spiculigera]